MKKFIALVLALLMLLSFAACSAEPAEPASAETLEATTEEVDKTNEFFEAYNKCINVLDCINVRYHLAILEAAEDNDIDYDLVEEYRHCSIEEFAQLLSENNVSFDTLDSICRGCIDGYAYDCLFDAVVCMMANGLIGFADGYFYLTSQM